MILHVQKMDTRIRLFCKEDGKRIFRMTLDLIVIYVMRTVAYLYLWERRLWAITLVGVLQTSTFYMYMTTSICSCLLVPTCCIGFYLIFVELLTYQEIKDAPYFRDPDAFVEHWSRTDIGNYLWVMEKGGKVIGSVAIERQACNTAPLSRMVIVPEFRGQGYSKKLLNHAIAHCKIRGYAAIELFTSSMQKEAYNLYERCGFERYQIVNYSFINIFNITDVYMYRLTLDEKKPEEFVSEMDNALSSVC